MLVKGQAVVLRPQTTVLSETEMTGNKYLFLCRARQERGKENAARKMLQETKTDPCPHASDSE